MNIVRIDSRSSQSTSLTGTARDAQVSSSQPPIEEAELATMDKKQRWALAGQAKRSKTDAFPSRAAVALWAQTERILEHTICIWILPTDPLAQSVFGSCRRILQSIVRSLARCPPGASLPPRRAASVPPPPRVGILGCAGPEPRTQTHYWHSRRTHAGAASLAVRGRGRAWAQQGTVI
jgi:hypothetical protein